ncbi:ectopic P granules protein 5 homolog [Penaeus chinensis]|uniref:ectopic P granules protein 5 homolog n=1 Tax=Penaeus chinensis TaxID=139456 RepID=UPI001FB81EEA|nr:ectopic P granules protein 5 homolog [Penaeus chinensis]
MAEAVRKKRTRIKKKVLEKCPVEDAKEEDCKEDPSMQELLDTYGDTPLPVLNHEEDQIVEDERQEMEVKEESDLLLDEKSVVKPVEKVVETSEFAENIFHGDDSLLADRGNLAEAVKTDVVDNSSAYRVHWEVAPGELSAPNFENLRQQLVQIEPYMEAQRQMKELMIEDATAKEYSESAPCPSAPIIDGGDIQYTDVEASAPCLAEDDAIAESEDMSQYPSATAPLLSDPVLSGATYPVDSQVRIEEESSHIKTKITLSEDSVIKPMTDVQINALYQNNELEENEKYIIKFLEEERNVPQLEFYELVLNYLRSRTSLISSQKELSTILEEYRKQMKNIWVFEKKTGTEEGECEDGRLLTVRHEYEVACFKEEIVTHVAKQLKQSRELLSESYALHAYTSEMAKLQVENHMQKVLSDCPEFMQVPKNAKIKASGTNEYNLHLQPHIKKLKMCISVLFAFQRRGVKDQQFIRDTRQWLTDFVAILQRFATRSDHLFLLNHIVRCPAGVGSWASAYIQIGGPWETDIIGRVLGCWPLDHSLTVLSTILSPVSSREDFLHHLKQSALPSGDPGDENTGDERASDTVWVVVDSSGEEEEDPTQLWAMFTENDVVQLLNQVPFKDIFQHMLMIEDVDGSLQYDVSRTSHHGLMKLFACATVLINLFCKGLSTYSMMRYRGATKRICRLLRHTVEYVTDHWQNFLLLYQSSPQQISDINQASTHWTSLQVEYDQLFEKAVHSIISSPRSGAWQFLAVIPYRSVSLLRLWKIVYQIHVGWSEESVQNSEKLSAENASYSDWADLVSHSDTRGQFHDRLMKIEENEALYLLTALANMAVERESTESHFVEVIVNNIFEATFVNEGTREALSRIGRDLLSTVASNHPISVSYLLTTTQEKISSVGNMALYLFRALPLELWEPSPDDITCVSHWLLFTPVASVENQLARIVLSKLNWGENTFGMQLFLPLELHRRVALTVLEAHLKVSREMRQGSLLTEGVKQVTSVMYAPSAEQVFCDWSWEILTCLRLHQLDQPEPWVHAVIASPALMLKDIPDPTNSAIAQGSSLNAVKRGLMDKQPLALFSALLLTSWGHSIPEFCEHGIDCIHELVMQGMYEAAIASMAHIMPLFFNQPEDITTHSKMMIAIQKCLTADQTYMTLAKSLVTSAFPGKILSLFAAMIVHHIKNYSRYCLSSGMLAVRFWQQMLVGVPDWVHDSNVLFLLDTICQHAFVQPQCWQEAISGFSEIMKNSDYQHNGGSGLSGLLSWLTSGTTAPNSLLVRSSAPQFPWFTIAVLSLETQGELASGLWKNLLLELYADPQTSLEVALKKISKELGLGQVSSSLLSIYRWGQQVVDLPADHPALPITMQMYFMLHLARVPPQPRQYECSSVINRFYQGFVNQSFLNKIKKKVTAALEHHEAVMAKESDEDEKDASHNVQISERVKLLRAMQSWLEESRLYDSGVYLPALPPNLLPKKLMQVFQANWEPWPEAVDVDATEEAGRQLLRVWDQYRKKASFSSTVGLSPSASPNRQGRQSNSDQRTAPRKTPTETILKRLTTYEPPQPPPPIPPMSPLHLPHIHDSTLTDQDALLYLVQRYTGLVVEHSQTVNLWCSELCALDCVYRELVPQLWSNAHTKTILTATCTPPKVGRKQPECSGHASIVMEFSEARLNEGIKVRIGQNREQHHVVLQRCQKPPPLQLCQAAVSLEAIITVLVNEFRRTDKNTNKQKWQFLLANGRQLFYHIVQLTSDDTSFYPPAKQLISSCAGILGQEFVRGHADCQESLVAQVLEWGGKLGGLLAPHFTPSVTPKHVFLMLYSTLSPYAPSAPDHTFMLLSKFDIERWLTESSPNSSDRSELINTIAAAFMSLLPGPNPTLLMVLELYRVHLRSLLSFKFPEHYTEVLNVMLQISASTQEDCGGVSSGLWYDLMNKISVGIITFSPEMERNALNQAIKEYAQHQTILSQSMVEDTLRMLSSYFVKQRLEFGLYGLYPKYRLHTQPIATFLGMISHAYIISAFHIKYGTPQEEMVREVWSGVDSLFAGWVTPLGGRDRQSFSPWLRHLTHDIRLLLPWAPSDTTSADAMVAMFAASVGFMHELLPGSSVLSLTLEYYCTMFAAQEVKSHVLAVIHAHFSALPWHHLHPSLQDTLIFTKVVEQYLPECHNFIGGVLVQINWNKVVQSAMSPTSSSSSTAEVQGQGQEAPSAVKLHTCLLNLLVRISMEPSVRQSSLLQTLLLEAESFSWWLVDSESFQRVVNWWVMSCDPRIVLALPDRNPVDVAIIQLLHRAAGYTPDTTSFHQDTPAKRGLLVRALVRLVTTAAARHKALLSAKPQVFNSTILGLLTHMEDTLTATVPKEHQWGEGSILGTELLAVVSGGASSTALQELSSEAVTSWLATQPHPSPGLLLPLVASASRTILQLNHRNPILHAGLSALFSKGDWCGWEGEVTWEHTIGILSFPLTNPTAMLTLAAQEGHLLVVYAYARWRRQQVAVTTDSFLQLTTLFDLLEIVTPNETTELELILLLSEILNLIVHLVKEKDSTSALWQHCRNFISHLALWAEDRSTTGILAAIGLGRQSPLSLAIRLICRALSTFLNLQMPKEGVFRTHPLHTHSDIDETQDSIKNDRCTLEQLRGLTANATYAGVSHSLTKTIQFVEDPTHCISDVTTLLSELVTDLILHPLLYHLTTTAKNRATGGPPQAAHSSQHFPLEARMCPSVSSTSASAPPPPPDDE